MQGIVGSFTTVLTVPETPAGTCVLQWFITHRTSWQLTGSWQSVPLHLSSTAHWLVLRDGARGEHKISMERFWQVTSFENYDYAMGFEISQF